MVGTLVRTFIGALAFGALVAVFASGTSSAEGKNDCTLTKDGDNDVVKACKAGGIKRAKVVMKSMTKMAKDKGKKWECDTCHKNEEDWKLTDDGEKLFKEMLEIVAAAKK
jgi:hypothetical protein